MKIPTLMIIDPNIVERVLIKDFTHFYNRGFSVDVEKDPITANLFTLEGHTWRNLRYKLTPTFTTGKLKGMFDQINSCGDHLVSYIEEETKFGNAIEGNAIINGFTLNVIASCAFGIQLDKDSQMSLVFRKIFKRILTPSRVQILRQILIMFSPKLARKLGVRSMPKDSENFVMTSVKETMKFREKNNINRNDFLQLMMNLKKQEKSGKVYSMTDEDFHPDDEVINQMKYASTEEDDDLSQEKQKDLMTDAVIAAQAFVFLIAGSDTVSSTINFALFCLSQNPEIQKKVQKEIDSVLEQSNRKWSYQVIKDMVYLEQVIQETLRMYPIATQLFRICTEPYQLPGSDAVIDKGTKVLIPVYAIHHDPQNYESPEVFDPDRFVDNNFKPSGSFLPFGDGPRICIGMRFAVLEVKLVLAKLFSDYTVNLNNKTQMPMKFHNSSVSLQVLGGLWFDFEKRTPI